MKVALDCSNNRNLKLYTVISSVWAIISGLIGPFFILYVSKVTGGMDKLGLAFCIMMLVQSITTYFVGRISDMLGRRMFLFVAAYGKAGVLLLYTLLTEARQIYLLQALFGMISGIVVTISISFLGDLTSDTKRGQKVGKYNAIETLSAGIGLLLGGYLVKEYGFKSMFYLASMAYVLSTILIFFIKEKAI